MTSSTLTYTLIWILIYPDRITDSNAQVLSYIEEYEIRSHLHVWSVTKLTLPITRCLVRSTDESTSASTLICDRRYNDTQVNEIVEGLSNARSLVGSLDLVCDVDHPENGTSDKQCVCLTVNLNRTETATNRTAETGRSDGERPRTSGVVVRPTMPDAADRSFQRCSYPKTLTRAMLRGYSRLRVLNIDRVGIEEIAEDAFDGFKSTLQVLHLSGLPLREDRLVDGLLCDMTELSFVLLSGLRRTMGAFPSGLLTCDGGGRSHGLARLIGVFASGNAFGALPPRALGSAAGSVLSLNLTNNRITTVSSGAFAGMTSLQELNLDDNELSALPETLLRSLKKLIYLSIQNNRLKTLDTALLKGLVSLRELNLRGNQLHAIVGSFGALPKINTLNLDHNAMAELNATMFDGCYNLQSLYLAHNRITYLHNETFSSLLFLTILKLNNNMLRDSRNLRAAFVRRLERLQMLDVSHNILTEILPRQFHEYPYIPRLQILNLSHNRIRSIAEDSFKGLSELDLISLSFNRLIEFERDTFRNLPKLRMLWIDQNELIRIPDDGIPPNVVWLSLSFNRIENFPRVAAKRKSLLGFYLGYNKIRRLNGTMFVNFPNVTILNLTHCELDDLAEATFEPMTRLQALDLSANRLKLNFSTNYLGNIYQVSYINLSINSIQSAENLFMHHFKYANFLDLSHNPLTVFPDQPKERPFGASSLPNRGQIGFLYLKNCSLVHVDPNAFELLPNLVHLDLSDNRLRRLDKLNIVTENDQVYAVYLDGNPLVCDCHMSWLLETPYDAFYKLSTCRLEATDDVFSLEAVSTDQFLCRETTNCLLPPVCQCFTDDETRRTVVYVRCSQANLTLVPRNIPTSARVVDLRGNDFGSLTFSGLAPKMTTTELFLSNSSISRIVSGQFSKFYKLELLDLSGNRLTELGDDVFSGLYRLRALFLHANFITFLGGRAFDGLATLTTLTLHDNVMKAVDPELALAIDDGLPYLENVTLGNNPWRCPCDNGTFKRWLLEKNAVLTDLADVRCNGTSVIDVADDRFSCYGDVRRTDETSVAFVAVGLMAALSVVCLVLFVVWHRNRLLFSVAVYYWCGWRRRRKEDDRCPYDAFLVYVGGQTIARLLIDEFIPRLEPPYRLFVSDRDSLPGRVRSEELMATIRRSRRTVFIVDESAVHSDLFAFTLQMAYNHSAESDNHHRTIVVVIDADVIKQQWHKLDDHLRVFIKAKQYLNWSDKFFWQKLIYFMPEALSTEEQHRPTTKY